MEINNPERQRKKREMVILKLKSGKQYRKWEKKQRRHKKEMTKNARNNTS